MTWRTLWTVCAGFVAVPVLAACSGGADAGTWAGTVETLANGASRVTNPAEGIWREGEGWHLEEDLVLGEMEDSGAATFGSISGLQADREGGIYVLDRQANELRIFDRAGTHVRSAGRTGEGPGEYTTANGLEWLSDDSLLVVDQEGNRYSILDRGGEYVRSVRRALGFFGWMFRGGIDGDYVYEASTIRGGMDDAGEPALLGTRLREQVVDARVPASEANVSEDAMPGTMDTILLPSYDSPMYEAFSIRTDRGGMVMGVPFTGTPHYRLDGDGGVWVGHGGAPRLYHTTFDGDTLTEIILGTPPAPVTAEEIAEWESGPGVERFKELGGKLDLGRIPETKPYFDGMTLDADGNLWLTVPAAPDRAVFAVLDPEGRYLGQLSIDGVSRDEYLTPVVKSDRLYFVGRDELDVPHVYVYRIMKSDTRTAHAGNGTRPRS